MARKVLNIGSIKWLSPSGRDCAADVTIEVKLGERWGERPTQARFSIVGDVRRPGAPDVDTCGQIINTIRDAKWITGPAIDLPRLLAIWERWHLNDMRAGCEHQRAAKWDERRIDVSKPRDAYITWETLEGRKVSTWNMLTWATRKDHALGLMCEPCPTCGYKYGTAWLREELPADVLAWFEALP